MIGQYAIQTGPSCLATVYTPVAGHTELATLFTDETGDTEGPNPVAVDASGRISIFVESGEYAVRFNIGDDSPRSSPPIMIEVA